MCGDTRWIPRYRLPHSEISDDNMTKSGRRLDMVDRVTKHAFHILLKALPSILILLLMFLILHLASQLRYYCQLGHQQLFLGKHLDHVKWYGEKLCPMVISLQFLGSLARFQIAKYNQPRKTTTTTAEEEECLDIGPTKGFTLLTENYFNKCNLLSIETLSNLSPRRTCTKTM